MLKKLVFVFALVSCLMFSLTAFASEITDVRWGVDKTNVLRFVVDCDKPDVVHSIGNSNAPQSRIEHIVQYGPQVAHLPVIVEPVVGILLPSDEAHV